MDIQSIKMRFGIIGNSPHLNRAIDVAAQVAPTDLTVLVTGESGTGKEVFPKIIHQLSSRKHGHYIAVNCGAIPEGTIDSELFGHEKGSFTGASDTRKGYFEVANGGTIFLDEVAELPLSTQVRLLRVLETGEFFKVGSSKTLKTDVRVVAATNVNVQQAIQDGKFREDLYYRLSSVPISIPPLRERKEDIHLIFRKFAADFAEKYRMPALKLTPEAVELIENYYWPGNIRQLKNITEQISIIETNKVITAEIIKKYLPDYHRNELPVLYNKKDNENLSERELLYKVLFDMQRDIAELKRAVSSNVDYNFSPIQNSPKDDDFEVNTLIPLEHTESKPNHIIISKPDKHEHTNDSEIIEESLSLQDKEKEMIRKALDRHRGKRKAAAKELGISERTLYRKIKEYDIR